MFTDTHFSANKFEARNMSNENRLHLITHSISLCIVHALQTGEYWIAHFDVGLYFHIMCTHRSLSDDYHAHYDDHDYDNLKQNVMMYR